MELHEVGTDDAPHTMWEGPGYHAPEDSGTAVDTGGLSGDSTAFDGSHDTGHDSGSDGSTDGSVDGQETGGTESGGSGGGSMTVTVDGETRTLPTSHDYDGDGHADAAVETSDGRLIVFTDTHDNSTGADGSDGKADEAYILDKSGHVVGAAHVDPSTGEWVDGPGADAATGPSVGDSGTGSGTDAGDPPTTDSGTVGGASTSADGGEAGGTSQPPQVVTVEVGGHEIGVAETIDTDHDGRVDTGVLAADGKIVALTDTDGDGDADRATVFDESGHEIGAMHVDPSTGEWVVDDGSGSAGTDSGDSGPGAGPGAGPADTGPGDSGSGGSGPGVGDGSVAGGETGTTTTGSGGTGTGSMTVTVDGETRTLPTSHDYTGDGNPDAAVQTSDGRTIVFTDTHDNSTGTPGPDGRADEAFIVDSSGHVVGAAHVDPSTGEWVDGTETGSPAPDTSTV
jgi:hypothetical protein